MVRRAGLAGIARAGSAGLGLLAAALLLLSACAGPQILAPGPGAPAAAIETSDQAFIARDGYRLRWSVWQAEGPVRGVIVALHGMNDYGETFRPAAEHWRGQGFTTYAYDQRGFGRTLGDGVWPGTDALTRDVTDAVRLVQARHPGVPVYLVGESMGGAVALAALGSEEPPSVAATVLIAPGLQGWSRLGWLERAGLWTLAHLTPAEPLSGRGLDLKPSDNVDRLKAMAADPFILKRVRADALYGLVMLMEAANQRLATVQGPVLFIHGDQDDIAPMAAARDAHSALGSRSDFAVIEGGFHLLLHGKEQDLVFNRVAAFFARYSQR